MNSGDPKGPLGLLLLEDSPTDSRLLMESLRDAVTAGQVVVQTVRRLADALRELKRFSFSCVLVDLGLPDGEGVGHVKRIREADAGVAIVVLTGLEDERAAQQAFELGAHDYLVKGRLWGEELLQVVRRAVAKARGASQPARNAEPVAAVSSGPRLQPWVDVTRGRFCGLHAEAEDGAGRAEAVQSMLELWRGLRENLQDATLLSLGLRANPDVEAGVLDRLPGWLRAAAVPAASVHLRVTVETLLRRTVAVPGLVRLRAEGMSILVEGWRPGAAPLDAITHIPLDGLILDGSLSRAVTEPDAEAAQRFVRATLSLAGALGMDVLAEGVMVAEQHARLSALGCRTLRGNWYCTPEGQAELPARWKKGPWGLDRRG